MAPPSKVRIYLQNILVFVFVFVSVFVCFFSQEAAIYFESVLLCWEISFLLLQSGKWLQFLLLALFTLSSILGIF